MIYKFDYTEVGEDGHRWTAICENCKNQFGISEDWLDECGGGKCMIHGCDNEADYYLDFPDDSSGCNSEFGKRVITKLTHIDKSIVKDDLYFSETAGSVYIEYKPFYPYESESDFIICKDAAGEISICGNSKSIFNFEMLIFENITDFENF